MSRTNLKIAEIEQEPAGLIACPPDLTGRWSEQFHHIADIVSTQSGLEPADAETIATVVRAQRRAAIHEQLALRLCRPATWTNLTTSLGTPTPPEPRQGVD